MRGRWFEVFVFEVLMLLCLMCAGFGYVLYDAFVPWCETMFWVVGLSCFPCNASVDVCMNVVSVGAYFML